jgi:DNA-binding response OmpR family regulator
MSTTSKTVLIVDDELFMLRLLECTFIKDDFLVVQVRNGADAVSVAIQQRPQLIVMDIMMPGLDGLSAVRQLKQNEATREIPIIVLSSRGHALTRVEAEQSGAALFLTKPFSPTQLRAEAKRILAIVGSGKPL